MKKTIQELTADFTAIIGDNKSDEVIAFLENLNDSITTEDSNLQSQYDELKTKFDNLDNEWREKYIKRFNDGAPSAPIPQVETTVEETESDVNEDITLNDIFTNINTTVAEN